MSDTNPAGNEQTVDQHISDEQQVDQLIADTATTSEEAEAKTKPAPVAFPTDLSDETLPEGWEYENDSITAGDYTFAVRFPICKTLSGWTSHADNVAVEANKELEEGESEQTGESIMVAWLNRLQSTGAKGGVSNIPKAKDDATRAKNIRTKQEGALSYFLGIMRGGRKAKGGLTAKAAEAYGRAVAVEMAKNKGKPLSPKKFAEIAAGLGIDLSALSDD